eukprot:6786079-Pyramimonas_sp.AAC.1
MRGRGRRRGSASSCPGPTRLAATSSPPEPRARPLAPPRALPRPTLAPQVRECHGKPAQGRETASATRRRWRPRWLVD